MKRGLFLLLAMGLLLTSGCAGYTHKRSLLNYDYPAHPAPYYTPPVLHRPFYGGWPYDYPYRPPYYPYFYP